MAPTDLPVSRVSRTYTFSEAIAYEKARLARNPLAERIRWVDARTGERVYIGWND